MVGAAALISCVSQQKEIRALFLFKATKTSEISQGSLATFIQNLHGMVEKR